jgi:PhnB protein
MTTSLRGLHRHLTVPDCAAAAAFYTTAFGAIETQRECLLDGHVLQMELAIGPHRLTLSEPWYAVSDGTGLPDAQFANGGVPHAEPTEAPLTVEVDHPDTVVERAVAAGCRVQAPVAGGAGTVVVDPAGNRWRIVARGDGKRGR